MTGKDLNNAAIKVSEGLGFETLAVGCGVVGGTGGTNTMDQVPKGKTHPPRLLPCRCVQAVATGQYFYMAFRFTMQGPCQPTGREPTPAQQFASCCS